MTKAEVDLLMVGMDADHQRVFQLFVGLGRERSLTALLALCTAQSIDVSMGSLKRWSSKFQWFDLTTYMSQKISDELAAAMLPEHVARAKADLEVIHTLKDRFYERVKLDPKDETLSDAEKLRIIDINLKDYLELVRTERLILGDPTERKEIIERQVHGFKDDDIERAANLLLGARYGLPPAPKHLDAAVVEDVEEAVVSEANAN